MSAKEHFGAPTLIPIGLEDLSPNDVMKWASCDICGALVDITDFEHDPDSPGHVHLRFHGRDV